MGLRLFSNGKTKSFSRNLKVDIQLEKHFPLTLGTYMESAFNLIK